MCSGHLAGQRHVWLVTSPTRQRVNTLRLIHSLARRACILNGFSQHGAVQLATRGAELVVDFRRFV